MTRTLTFAVLALFLFLVGCEREPRGEVPLGQRPPLLVDAPSQTYQFMDGRCRSIAQLPAPWRLQPADFLPPLINRRMNFEADAQAFGIPAPAKNRAAGEDQRRVRITLGTRGRVPDPNDSSLDSLWRILYGTYDRPLGEPIEPRWPLPEGFKAYMHPSGSGRILYYDPQRRMIVVDDEVDYMPNGWIDGVIWLTDREAIGFRIPYEALGRLDVLADSFQALPSTLLVPCPASPSYATAPRSTSP
jgi:hypothetical protein